MNALGLNVETVQLSPTVSLADALDNAAQRGLLYAVIITSQHEMHRSLTITILHGRNPQGEAAPHVSRPQCLSLVRTYNVLAQVFRQHLDNSFASMSTVTTA